MAINVWSDHKHRRTEPSPSDSQDSRRRWVRSIGASLSALACVDSLRAADVFWRAVPAFRYVEADDWRLAGDDLRRAMVEPLARDEELRRRVIKSFKAHIRDADLKDPRQIKMIAEVVDLLRAAERADTGLPSRDATSKVPPSARVDVRPTEPLLGIGRH